MYHSDALQEPDGSPPDNKLIDPRLDVPRMLIAKIPDIIFYHFTTDNQKNKHTPSQCFPIILPLKSLAYKPMESSRPWALANLFSSSGPKISGHFLSHSLISVFGFAVCHASRSSLFGSVNKICTINCPKNHLTNDQ